MLLLVRRSTLQRAAYRWPLLGKALAMDDEERKVAKVPVTLGVVMGIFLVVAAVVAILIWAL
jgi:hypothetical protein